MSRPPLRKIGLALIADDYKDARRLLGVLMTNAGWDIRFAEDGKAALRAYERETFDLVLMDVQMPLMTGVDVVRRIRAEATAGRAPPPPPIVGVTAFATYLDARDRALFDALLGKPLSVQSFYAAIGRVVDGGPSTPSASPGFKTQVVAADNV